MADSEPAAIPAEATPDPPPAATAAPRPPAPDDPDELFKWSRARLEDTSDPNGEEAALEGFSRIVREHPTHATAEYAAQLVLDILNRLGRYDELAAVTGEMLASAPLLRGRPDLVEVLGRLEHVTSRKRAESLEAAREYAACGRAYLELFNQAPDSAFADELLYNAGVCFEQARDVGRAVVVFEQLTKTLPRSRLAQRGLFRSAVLYESIARFDRAADAYVAHATRYPGERLADDGLLAAIHLREALGDASGHARAVELYVRFYGKRRVREAATVFLRLARARGARGTATLIRELRGYLRQFGRRGGAANHIDVSFELAHALWNGSCKQVSRGLCRRQRRDLQARQATAMMKKAISMAARLRDDEQRASVRWVERARVALIDAELELETQKKRPSPAALSAIAGRYRALATTLETPWALVALERVAVLAPAVDKLPAYKACLDRAMTLKVARRWFAACDDAVHAADPARATPREKHGRAALAPVISTAGFALPEPGRN